MDKFKGVAKNGWKPSGDRPIHRESWKSDLKGMATGKKKDPYEEGRNHVSRPLNSLQDPDSFGPPPKHSAYYGPNASSPSRAIAATPTSSTGGGLGSAVPAPSRRQTQQDEEEEAPKPPPGPYRSDTTGLRTDNLPAPPVRRAGTGSGTSSPAPAPPPRANPSLPPRAPPRSNGGPPPILPPRQNEYPDEHTPAPPPTYGEAVQTQQANPASLNQGAINRLGQAGVSVPGFGIGNNSASPTTQSPSTQGHPTQLNELQQRFACMGTGSSSTPHSPAQAQAPSTPTWQQGQAMARQGVQAASAVGATSSSATAAPAAPSVAGKKPAPPPPPKKNTLIGGNAGGAPPPIPMSSKPRPS